MRKSQSAAELDATPSAKEASYPLGIQPNMRRECFSERGHLDYSKEDKLFALKIGTVQEGNSFLGFAAEEVMHQSLIDRVSTT